MRRNHISEEEVHHGKYGLKAYPTVTSNMLDPTDEETAMSPNPLRATMTLVMRSGIDVPAAKKVRPITCENK